MSITRDSAAGFQPDVIVVGGGLIGLCCATALARENARVMVVSAREDGAASPAAAGLLAPSVGVTPDPARALGIAALEMYPDYLDGLAERTGRHVPLRRGVLELAFTEAYAATLQPVAGAHSAWLDSSAVRDLEPTLSPAVGSLLHSRDGMVDVRELLAAVDLDAARDDRVSLRIGGPVVRLHPASRPIRLELADGRQLEGRSVVIAAGAWAGRIAGLPRPLPITPVRGQMLAIEPAPLRHVIMGPRGYVAPQTDRLVVGSTMERVGFDPKTTEAAAVQLRQCAVELSPALASHRLLSHWSGLRPMTPDLLPIVGEDPDVPGVFYACGHSRNGILLAPLTGMVIAELLTRGATSLDVSPWALNPRGIEGAKGVEGVEVKSRPPRHPRHP